MNGVFDEPVDDFDIPGFDEPRDTVPEITPTFVEVPVGDLMRAQIDPPREIIQQLVYAMVATLLGAHGGAGKSILALILGAHVAAGRSWAGFRVAQCAVVYVSLEDDGALVRWRLRNIVERYDLPPDLVARNMRIIDGSAGDPTLAVEVSQAGVRRLTETAAMLEMETAIGDAGLVIIDNASDAYGGDEIQRRQVRWFVRRLVKIARRNGGGLILLAHIDKAAAKSGSQGNSYSGSTAWHNSVRSRLALIPTEGDDVELVHEKSNFGRKAEPVRLVWDGPVLVPAGRDRVAEKVRAERSALADADALLGIIEIAVQTGITVPAAMSGPATAYQALEVLPELKEAFLGKTARKRVAAAIVALLRGGRLRKVEYRTPARHIRVRLEPVGTGATTCVDAPDGPEKSARVIPPIPPCATGALAGACASPGYVPNATTGATGATGADVCPACAGEGCPHCQVTA